MAVRDNDVNSCGVHLFIVCAGVPCVIPTGFNFLLQFRLQMLRPKRDLVFCICPVEAGHW